MRKADVAVVGMACVFPGATDLRTYWRNLVGGVDAITDLPPERWPGSRNHEVPPGHGAHIAGRRGGFIPTPYLFDPMRHGVMPGVARDGDPDQFLLLDVVADALADAGVAVDDPRRVATDLIVGRGGYTSNRMVEIFLRADGIERLLGYLDARLPGLDPARRDALDAGLRAALPSYNVDGIASTIPNLVPSRAANRLDLGGSAFTVDGACASSLLALETAVQRLRDGRCDVAVAAGVNFTQVPSFWWLFDRILAASPSQHIRPFDARADGLLIGEGAGAVVLERVEDAARRGHPAYVLVKGAGSASDGRKVGVLAPSPEGQVRALRKAYDDADVDPSTVGFVEAHGTATHAGDAAELETLRRVFGPPRGGHGVRPLGAVKSMLGHLMPAAGMAAFIKTALSLSNKVVPPSLHCERPHGALAETDFWVPGEARPWLATPGLARRAGVNAFGFGGINAHVVLEEVPPRPARARRSPRRVEPRPVVTGARRPTEGLFFSGPTREAVAARLRRAADFLEKEGSPVTAEELASALAGEADAAHEVRLVLVVPGLDGLPERLRGVAGEVEAGTVATRESEMIYFEEGREAAGGRLAAVFPGLAFPGLVGEFPRHLVETCLHFPAAREVFDHVEHRDARPDDPLPTSFLLLPPAHLPPERRAALTSRFAPPPRESSGAARPPADRRSLAHMGMLATNEAGWRVLRDLGVKVDVVCGQSLGDLSAVLAAGMTRYEDNVGRFWRAFDIDLPYEDTGIIAMVGATEEELAPHLARHPGVTIGLHFSPGALMVGGGEEDVRALVAELRAARILAQPLPFPPIHTPRLKEVEAEFARAMGPMDPLRPANLEIWSAVLAAPMPPDPAEVERLLRTNVSRPIRFWQTMRAMADAGTRFVVQIGTGTLASNSRTVLERDDVVCVAMDAAHRHPLTQVQAMAGRLFAHGLAMDPRGLLAAVETRPLDLDRPAPAPAPPRTALPLTLYWAPFTPLDGEGTAAAPPPAPPRAAPPTEPEPRGAGPLPLLGVVLSHEPGVRLETRVTVDMEEHRYLEDHLFGNGKGVRPARDLFPVVPLTMTLEMLAEHAACLAPGLGLVALENVRAQRWIALEDGDPLEVTVRAEVVSRDAALTVVRVEASAAGERRARADVHLAAAYAETVRFAFTDHPEATPFHHTARSLYEEGILFHGPRFRCLTAVGERRGDSLTGTLDVLPADDLFASNRSPQLLCDPVVLDGAGQLVGAWFADEATDYVLPVAVDRIEFFRPSPPVGARCPTRIELRSVDREGRSTLADIEVQDGEGGTWFRIRGWQDVIFTWDPRLLAFKRRPARATLSTAVALPGLGAEDVAVLLPRTVVGRVRQDWLARDLLDAGEEAGWRDGDGTARRKASWLMGRAAAKDAARIWLARRAGEDDLVHPASLHVDADPSGRPVLRWSDPGASPAGRGNLPCIALSHGDDAAVALASRHPVGVDLEPVHGAAAVELSSFATAAEAERLAAETDGLDPVEWRTRLWCAKEAASKAWGTGLRGRPRDFEAMDVARDGTFLVALAGDVRVLTVATSVHEGHVVAIAVDRDPR